MSRNWIAYGRGDLPRIVTELKGILVPIHASPVLYRPLLHRGRHAGAVAGTVVGWAKVDGIDLNKPRMRRVAEAILALSWRPEGFTSSDLDQRGEIQ